MERCGSLYQFAQTLPDVHAADIYDCLRGWIEMQFLPRVMLVHGMEDREVATADHGAGLFWRSTHGHDSFAKVIANREEKVGFVEKSSGVHCREPVLDVVDIGPHAHGDDGNLEGLADFERGVSI